MVCSFLLLWARLGTGVIGMNQVLLCPHGALSQVEATVATQGSWPRRRRAGCLRSQNGAPDPAWKTQAGFLEAEEPSKLKPRSRGSPPDEGQRGVPRRACPCPPHCRPLNLGPVCPGRALLCLRRHPSLWLSCHQQPCDANPDLIPRQNLHLWPQSSQLGSGPAVHCPPWALSCRGLGTL